MALLYLLRQDVRSLCLLRSTEEVEIRTFILLFFLFHFLLFLCATCIATCSCTTTTSCCCTTAATTTHGKERFHAGVVDQLREEHWPIGLNGASRGLNQVVHGGGVDLGPIIVEDESGIGAEEFVLLLFGKLGGRHTSHSEQLLQKTRRRRTGAYD